MKVGARYYDPEFGVFLTRDTDLSQKPYAYCDGDPVNRTDPTGHGFFGTIFNTVVNVFKTVINLVDQTINFVVQTAKQQLTFFAENQFEAAVFAIVAPILGLPGFVWVCV